MTRNISRTMLLDKASNVHADLVSFRKIFTSNAKSFGNIFCRFHSTSLTKLARLSFQSLRLQKGRIVERISYSKLDLDHTVSSKRYLNIQLTKFQQLFSSSRCHETRYANNIIIWIVEAIFLHICSNARSKASVGGVRRKFPLANTSEYYSSFSHQV